MVTALTWRPSYRLISSRYPTKSVYDRIVDTANFAKLLELEMLTNPRAREEAGDFRKVRPADFISGPQTTPIMASFAYAGSSRFCDGTYGVYYASSTEDAAIEETRFHTERFLRATKQPSVDLDNRVYTATIVGRYDDIRTKSKSKLYDPDPQNYGYSQRYASGLYRTDAVDGIVYNSVRFPGGQCVVVFRPRLISDAKVLKYVQFRWNGLRVDSVLEVTSIRTYP